MISEVFGTSPVTVQGIIELLNGGPNLHARFVKNDNLDCHAPDAVPDKAGAQLSTAFILLGEEYCSHETEDSDAIAFRMRDPFPVPAISVLITEPIQGQMKLVGRRFLLAPKKMDANAPSAAGSCGVIVRVLSTYYQRNLARAENAEDVLLEYGLPHGPVNTSAKSPVLTLDSEAPSWIKKCLRLENNLNPHPWGPSHRTLRMFRALLPFSLDDSSGAGTEVPEELRVLRL
ncbi:hypothetical protein F5888DRAFT_1633635 [Russula emetica]|nr:hypothetical protein F5888DRAFT_1633635 [Russula emetica]